jgi:small-conductance mechanosensitive channel
MKRSFFRRSHLAFAAVFVLASLLCISGWGLLHAQSPQTAPQAPQTTAAPSTPASNSPQQQQRPAPGPPAKVNRDDIVNHLNAAISWYRDATTKLQTPGEPSDVVYQDNAQNFAAQALRLAFQSAKEEADVLSAPEKDATADDNAPDASGQPNYTRFQTRMAQRMADLQSQLDAQNKAIETATGPARQQAIAKRDALQGQMDLYKSMQDAVQKMSTFAETTEASSNGLEGTINTLARSVPEVLENPKNAPSKAPAAQTRSANSTGLVGQIIALYDQLSDMHALDGLIAETNRLRDTANIVRKPLRDHLTATLRAGNAIVTQSPAAQPAEQSVPSSPAASGGKPGTARKQPPVPAPGSAADVQKRYRDLTQDFRSYSEAMVPLAQEMALLDQSRSNFQEWRRSISRQSRVTLQSLLTRVVGLALALGAVFLLSDLWRRLTFRYVRDARRRRQFLLLRRFVTGFLFGIVIILGFVSEFSSLATFAGFVTAGIAVGLQTVLLSVAAYFFVIGRYGIRVGDRISIAGVTGDVIDVGLVRLYIMELAGPAVDLYPTGRIVVFSNSVLFQAATPLFKQLPGTDYTWHEVVLDLVPGGNHKAAQEKIAAAMNSVYEKYRAEIEQQMNYLEGIQMNTPRPDAKLQFTDAGLELLVRYPVGLRKEAEIDEQVTRTLLDLINGDPELKSSVSATPKIRAVVKG